MIIVNLFFSKVINIIKEMIEEHEIVGVIIIILVIILVSCENILVIKLISYMNIVAIIQLVEDNKIQIVVIDFLEGKNSIVEIMTIY